jgi:hypothetical protein
MLEPRSASLTAAQSMAPGSRTAGAGGGAGGRARGGRGCPRDWAGGAGRIPPEGGGCARRRGSTTPAARAASRSLLPPAGIVSGRCLAVQPPLPIPSPPSIGASRPLGSPCRVAATSGPVTLMSRARPFSPARTRSTMPATRPALRRPAGRRTSRPRAGTHRRPIAVRGQTGAGGLGRAPIGRRVSTLRRRGRPYQAVQAPGGVEPALRREHRAPIDCAASPGVSGSALLHGRRGRRSFG